MTTTTIDPNLDLMTLINVFGVDPARCDELVEDLAAATDETISPPPLTRSSRLDRRRASPGRPSPTSGRARSRSRG